MTTGHITADRMTAFRKYRRLFSEAIDASLVAASIALAFLLRFDFSLGAGERHMLATALGITLAAKLVTFRFFSLRDLAWGHVGFEDLARLTVANVTASVVSGAAQIGRAHV